MNEQPQPTQSQPPVTPTPPAAPATPSETTTQAPQPSQPFVGDQATASNTGFVGGQSGPVVSGQQPGVSTPHQVVVAKDKTVAVLLAVFLGFWTWLYTYQKDSKKFWINLALSIVTIGFWGIVGWIWAIIDTVTKPESYYLNYFQQQPQQ